MCDGEGWITVEDTPARDTSVTESQAPACKFRKVHLSGRPPAKGEVAALMMSLEARGAAIRALETDLASSGAFAKVLPFRQK